MQRVKNSLNLTCEQFVGRVINLFLYSIRLLVEQRASTVLRQRTLLAAIFSAVFQLMFAFFISSSIDLLQVINVPMLFSE